MLHVLRNLIVGQLYCCSHTYIASAAAESRGVHSIWYCSRESKSNDEESRIDQYTSQTHTEKMSDSTMKPLTLACSYSIS